MLRGGNLRRAAIAALPESARAGLFGAASAVAVMVFGGGLLFTASLILHFERVLALTRGLAADPVGGGALALLGVAFVPNLVVWAATFTLGSGFSVDAGSVVAPGGVDLGAFPAFPVLGALPDSGVLSGWTYLVMLVPVAAGAVLGHAVNRGMREAEPLRRVVVATGAAGVSAVALGGLAYLSGGAWATRHCAKSGRTRSRPPRWPGWYNSSRRSSWSGSGRGYGRRSTRATDRAKGEADRGRPARAARRRTRRLRPVASQPAG